VQEAKPPARHLRSSGLRRETAAINEYVRRRASLPLPSTTSAATLPIDKKTGGLPAGLPAGDLRDQKPTTHRKTSSERLADMRQSLEDEKAGLGIVPPHPEPTLGAIAAARAAAKRGGGVFYSYRENNELHARLKSAERGRQELVAAEKALLSEVAALENAFTGLILQQQPDVRTDLSLTV